VLIPAVPIIIGLVLTLGAADPSAIASVNGTPAALTFSPNPPLTMPTPLQKTAPWLSVLPSGPGALVAQIVRPTTMRKAPGGRAIARIGLRSNFGSPSVVLVVRHRDGWLGVISTQSGNGGTGWIRQTDTSLRRVTLQINVSLSARRLTVVDGDKVLQRYSVAVGKPTAPTPTGRFEVTDRLATGDPAGPYGCCILALSAQAPHAIQGWGGGNRIAIHSTPETWSIGQPVSHGCIRLTLPEGRWLMTHVPLGTPTVISG
jgi:lipoprotein-anchoring transpeptidase ErfK/SrfK